MYSLKVPSDTSTSTTSTIHSFIHHNPNINCSIFGLYNTNMSINCNQNSAINSYWRPNSQKHSLYLDCSTHLKTSREMSMHFATYKCRKGISCLLARILVQCLVKGGNSFTSLLVSCLLAVFLGSCCWIVRRCRDNALRIASLPRKTRLGFWIDTSTCSRRYIVANKNRNFVTS